MRLYRSAKCGVLAELISSKDTELECCGEAMEALKPGTTDAAVEKHVPAVTVDGNRVLVQVGSVAHPMTKEHYIQFILVKAGALTLRKDLTPEDEPKAVFSLGDYHGPIEVYEYCNLHGLWKADAAV